MQIIMSIKADLTSWCLRFDLLKSLSDWGASSGRIEYMDLKKFDKGQFGIVLVWYENIVVLSYASWRPETSETAVVETFASKLPRSRKRSKFALLTHKASSVSAIFSSRAAKVERSHATLLLLFLFYLLDICESLVLCWLRLSSWTNFIPLTLFDSI